MVDCQVSRSAMPGLTQSKEPVHLGRVKGEKTLAFRIRKIFDDFFVSINNRIVRAVETINRPVGTKETPFNAKDLNGVKTHGRRISTVRLWS